MWDLLLFLSWLNRGLFTFVSTIVFFGVAVYLTFKTKFVQIRAFPQFISILFRGSTSATSSNKNKISSLRALFTAMATTIGTGNVVGPSVAIISGGPGALFWLLIYIFFGAVTKFVEVIFAMYTRIQLPDGRIVGGPMEYLKSVSPLLARWYTSVIILLFISWSSVQANTLARIFELEHIPHLVVGALLGALVLVVVQGGAQRVGAIASKLVPLMFVLYVSFSLMILFKNPYALLQAVKLVISHIFSPSAPLGAFLGASVFHAMRHGIYRGILITEAGVGTSSIPHAVADTNYPIDQAILAMCSTIADASLSALSGMLVLVTGVWLKGSWRTTLIYEVFSEHSPVLGRFVLLIAISLFVITTIIGNSFNGIQSFSSLTRGRWTKIYIWITAFVICISSTISTPLIWEIMDTLVTLVAIPNLIGLVILARRKPECLSY